MGLNFSEDLFFFFSFGLHLILGKKIGLNFTIFGRKSEKIFCATLVSEEIWGPGIDLRTPWKNFFLRP